MSRVKAPVENAWLGALLVLVVTLVPLLLPRADIQSDEIAFWVGRSERFLEAMQAGTPGATVQTKHPGVTTMIGRIHCMAQPISWRLP